MNPQDNKIQTKIVDNFSGQITPENYGDLNSGLCPIAFVPFGKATYTSQYQAGGLEFLPSGTAIGVGLVTAPIMEFLPISNFISNKFNPEAYGVALDGSVYRIIASDIANSVPDYNNVSKFDNGVGNNAHYGGGILISSVSGNEKIYVGHDAGVSYGTAFTSSTGYASTAWNLMPNTNTNPSPRPIAEFVGLLFMGDGFKLVQSSNGTTWDNTAADVFTNLGGKSLPQNYTIKDLRVSPDGRYLMIAASQNMAGNTVGYLDLSTAGSLITGPMNSVLVFWNGSDKTYNSLQFFKGVNITAIATSNTDAVIFGRDEEGMAIYDTSGNKLNSLRDVSATLPILPPNKGSIYGIGRRFYFQATCGNSVNVYVYDMTNNSLVQLNNEGVAFNNVVGGIVVPSLSNINTSLANTSYTKIFYSYSGSTVDATNTRVKSMHLRNFGDTSFQVGTYATQCQKFQQKILIKEVRVFTTSTASGDSFTISLLNNSGQVLTGSSSVYTFAAGASTDGKGAIDMYRYNPQMKPVMEFAVKISNTGGTGIIFKKVEVDYEFIRPQNA